MQPYHTIIRNKLHELKDTRTDDQLEGNCPIHAVMVHDALSPIVDTSLIIRGGVMYPDKPRPKSSIHAEDMGAVHWWNEVCIGGKWYTVDLHTEVAVDGPAGSIYTNERRPKEYIPFQIMPDGWQGFR